MIKFLAPPLLLLGSLLAAVSPVQGSDSKTKDPATKPAPPLHATLSTKSGGAATSAFSASQPQLSLDYQGVTLAKGDKVRAVWIIEDGGKTITPNAKVSEFTLAADGPTGKGNFHLAKPAAGWPLGKWRVDVYVNDVKVESLKFTVQ